MPQFVLDELSDCQIECKHFLGEIDNRHKIKIHEHNIVEDIDLIIENAKKYKVLIICNTVKKAQEIYQTIFDRNEDIEIHLLHSRYTKKHRRILENDVIEFSKSVRTGICISTQIVEASLDIDFDILYTHLSSIDSLIQRMGRVFRKRKNINHITNVHIYTIKDGIGTIYDKIICERTLKYLKQYDQKIFLEKDKINCMNDVYKVEELKHTKYMKLYNEKKEFLQKLSSLEMDLNKVDAKFRNINSIMILPEKYYQLTDVTNLIKKINGEKYQNKKYQLISQLSEYCINYTLYKTIDKDSFIDIVSCVEGEEIHRSICKYEFDEQTHRGIGLDVKMTEDEEYNFF